MRTRSLRITWNYAAATLACLASAVAPGAAFAKHVYQYRDANGQLHYTDRKPADGEARDFREARIGGESNRIVELTHEDRADGRHFSGMNRLAGPVGITLELQNAVNAVSEPDAPVSMVLAPLAETPIALVHAGAEQGEPSYQAALSAVPGDPNATPSPDVVYQLPIPKGTLYQVIQGFGAAASHSDRIAHYSVDIGVDEGTPVLAARPGIVMQLESDFSSAGLNKEKSGPRANIVRILHPDGSMAIYAHLQPDSALVSLGQSVRAGQEIARTGSAGPSAPPHLHFSVQVNDKMNLISIAFRMNGVSIPGQ